ncbi:hypothetical protein BDN70DRAFT_882203 [Pholiota conissans]|uniref:AMP-dependent synthetase/ligase domain-containing protein n=1 Tax=Pholiota conissans TaxID=109636 RepID=A0A9P5YVS4_9AGAR|nr:hypothetical protein BDN70DRAFT_882203 [Pholiota conissans]
MALSLSNYLLTDDLTILLALISVTVFLLNNLYKPQPLVHPILLGRQSDVGRARNPGESAVYRNYSTGLMGRFPVRPGKEVHIIADFVKPEVEAPRTLWSTKLTNGHLIDRAAAFGTGLLRLSRVQPQKSNVLLLLNDCLEFIVADLALASHSIKSITLSSSTLLSAVLESHQPSAIITHAFLLPQLLELIYDSDARHIEHTLVVVGEPSVQAMASVASNVKVLKFADLEHEGFKAEKILSPVPRPSDVFTMVVYESEGQVHGAQFTHENMTAGVAAVRALFPTNVLSPLDTILSTHPMSTAYGRAVAYAAIYEGTSFATLPSSELYHVDENSVKPDNAEVVATRKYPTPAPTVLFIRPGHLGSIVTGITKTAEKGWVSHAFAWRHKIAGLAEGFITNQSLWDRLVFDSARAKVLGHAAPMLRAVVVSGGPIPNTLILPARVALSVPLVNAFTHPLSPTPILASHPLDLQELPNEDAHTGPPGINVEVKLRGVDDDAVEGGADPVGEILVRGPPVGKRVGLEDYVNVGAGGEDQDSGDEPEWIVLGVRARVQTNGAFVVVGDRK